MELKKTPLHRVHLEMKALMAPFGGWDMPIQYQGILAEHRQCRERAALFDVSHMGEFYFQGDMEASGLESIFTFSVRSIPVGRSRYGFLLNDSGGIVDDLIVFRLSEDEAMVVVNAATIEKDFADIRNRLRPGATFIDISENTAKLDLQGPLSRDVLLDVARLEVEEIPYFRFKKMNILGRDAIVSRTGYTGELGYEIFLPADKAEELWSLLLADERVRGAGLGARDVLRLEVGYSLYGSDIDETTTPLEAGLEMFVDFDKDFVGKEALVKQRQTGVHRRRVAFRTASRRAPRHDYEILHRETPVGKVTSGVFSPMLGCGIGLGYVSTEAAALGTPLVIRQEKVSMEAEVVPLPFYSGGSLRK